MKDRKTGDRVSRQPDDRGRRDAGGTSLYTRLSVPGAEITDHRRWASLDALRAIAALMVLASHAILLGPAYPDGPAKHLARLGVGVWIFFAASGYLIAGPFLRALLDGRPGPSVGRYALRREVRIFPAYWVALAAILIVGGSTVAHWWQLPVHAVLAQGLVPDELKRVYLVAWSLGVEVIFYALVPLGAWLAARAARRRPVSIQWLGTRVLALWGAAVALSLALAVAFPFDASGRPPGGVQVLALVGSLANFCPGMIVFLAVTASERAPSRLSRGYLAVASRPVLTLPVAGVVFLIATQIPYQTSHVVTALQGPLLGIASGLVLAVFVHGAFSRPLVRILAPIGLISYGVYLWHWVILRAIGTHYHGLLPGSGTGLAANLARLAILLALTLPVALLSWLALERPLLRRSSSWGRKRRTAPARADQPIEIAPQAAGRKPLPASSGSS